MKKTLLMLALAAGITCFAQNAQAAIVNINISPTGFNIGGPNGGVSNGSSASIGNFPISGNYLFLNNNLFNIYTGLDYIYGSFASGDADATPVKFSLNASIGDTSIYRSGLMSFFRSGASVSPDFGPGSYMGFKTAQGNYGWLKVTWTAASNEFEIFSGAYEDQVGVAILAGAGAGPGPAAVPEPGTWAAAALLAGGAGFMRWRKRAKVA
jgi:hypothetical protein